MPKGSESHSGTDVAIYARGPWAQLVDGTMEQNDIYHVMRYVSECCSEFFLKALLLSQEPRSSQALLLESDRSPAVEQAIENGPTPCSGRGILPGKCNCAGDEPDICGICGGSSVPSIDPRIRGQPVLNLESCDCVGHGERASHSLHTTILVLLIYKAMWLRSIDACW